MIKIILDGYGGDHAPESVLKGAELAIEEFGDVEIIITGNTDELKNISISEGLSLNRIELVNAKTVISVEEDYRKILKEQSESSMAVGLRLLKSGEGDAFVSGGSTGALVIGSSSLIKRIRGIRRAAIAPVMPTDTGCFMLIDAGANTECRPDMLLQFAIMGSSYMNKVMGVDKPRVGLINIGTEENKGSELYIDAYQLLKNAPINFIGNVEARDIPLGACDVGVADGFTGNIILKLEEGMGKFLIKNLKEIFSSSFVSKFAAALVIKNLKEFKQKMDYTEYGGAALLGVSKPVIKAHGSSDAKAFKNAIKQARSFVLENVIDDVTKSISEIEKYETKSKG